MPSVYIRERTQTEFLEELLQVLGNNGGNFREQWSIQAEAVVEPVGWEALWRLSKEFCQKLGVRFPCVAHVRVLGVDWEGLSASLEVIRVQHEGVKLPDRREDVPLIELWPTIQQEEKCVDAQSTAEFIQLLRFYYIHLWMPWDELEERMMLPATLEQRMKLYVELHDHSVIPTRIARQITLLRNEAICTYHKIRDVEGQVDSDDLNDDDDSMLPDNYLSRVAELQARLDYLRSKWTTFENPHIRSAYVAEQERRLSKESRATVNILWSGGSMFDLQQLCAEVGGVISRERRVAVCWSAEDALATKPAVLLVCSPRMQVPDVALSHMSIRGMGGPTLSSSEVRSCLLTINSDCQLLDLTLQCSQTSAAILLRYGELRASNCRVTDDSDNCLRDFVQGVVVMEGAKLVLENCRLDNLYTGLVVHRGAVVELRNCTIERCGVGIQMFSGARVRLVGGRVSECAEQCVRYELDTGHEETTTGDRLEGLDISSCCKVGNNAPTDIVVVKQESTPL